MNTLTDTNIQSITPKDINSSNWSDDMRDWPDVQYGDIYNYLVSQRACDGDEMKNYKSMDSYNYFKSGSVGRILHYQINTTFIIMKSDVHPSQRIRNKSHHPWILCHLNGTIYDGGCSCLAGNSKTCSRVGAMLWKIEYAVKRSMTGKSCTDIQALWNKGTTKNIEPGPVAGMDFSKPKYAKCEDDMDEDVVENVGKSTFQSFHTHSEFLSFNDSSPLKPLFYLQNSIIYKSTSAETNNMCFNDSTFHSDHTGDLSCMKCEKFYKRFVQLTPTQISDMTKSTVDQAKSDLLHDSRKLRITGSTSHKVPVRDTTNPDNFIREHLYPTFRGNIYTKHGQDGENKAKQQLREEGEVISDVGTIISCTQPWLSVSPDGIIQTSNGDQLLEIKCPFLKDESLDSLITSGKYDVVKESGNYVMKMNGARGYYLQVQLTMHVTGLPTCKFVVWSNSKYVSVSVPYNPDFCERSVSRLKCFYFSKFLPRIIDDFESGRMRLSAQYAKLSQ